MPHTSEVSSQKRKLKPVDQTENLVDDQRKWKERYPWALPFYRAKARCNNPSHDKYFRYGGSGIKLLMTKDDFKFLWFRDNAQSMHKPSIDRIDTKGNYELSNCRFIPHRDNCSRYKLEKTHCIHGHVYSEENTHTNYKGHRYCRICRRVQQRKDRITRKMREAIRSLGGSNEKV